MEVQCNIQGSAKLRSLERKVLTATELNYKEINSHSQIDIYRNELSHINTHKTCTFEQDNIIFNVFLA